MTIAAQLKQTRDTIADWARANRGRVVVASDLYHLVYLLRQSPGTLLAAILFHGEAKRGDIEERGAVDRTFWVVITRGQGLKIEPGASLTDGVAGGKPMFDLIEEAREMIRGLSFDADTTEVSVNYLGCEPFAADGFLVDAQKLTFSIGVQLPAVQQPQNPASPDPELS